MALLFFDDQAPESDEYNTNYYQFDESIPSTLREMMRFYLEKRRAKHSIGYELIHEF